MNPVTGTKPLFGVCEYSGLSGALLAVLVVACAPSAPPLKPRAPLLSSDEVVDDASSPASWYYHPTKPATLRTRLTLDGGRTLFAGERGERWLVEEKQ